VEQVAEACEDESALGKLKRRDRSADDVVARLDAIVCSVGRGSKGLEPGKGLSGAGPQAVPDCSRPGEQPLAPGREGGYVHAGTSLDDKCHAGPADVPTGGG